MLDKNVQRLLEMLPVLLSERTRVLNSRPVDTNGEFVLYWMHHAVRDHENPALDSAIRVADHPGQPVQIADDPEAAVDMARRSGAERLLVTGSFFVVGPVQRAIGLY